MSASWKEVPEERYDEALGVLPPAVQTHYGFLVGEPHDHRKCSVHGHVCAEYAAFVYHHGRFYEGPNMTAGEFRRLDVSTVPQKKQ